MKYLFPYLKKYKAHGIIAPIFKMIEALLDLSVPLIVTQIVDIGIVNNDRDYIISRFILMLIVAFAGLACSVTAQYFAARAAVATATGLRHDLMSHIEQLSSAEIDKFGRSTLITRVSSDVNQVQNGINMLLRMFLRTPIIVFGAAIMAFVIKGVTGLVFVGVIVALFFIIFGIMRITTPMYAKVQRKLDNVTVSTREALNGVRVVRSFCQEQHEEDRFKHINHELTHTQLHVGHISAALHPLTHVAINIGIVLILWVGAKNVEGGLLLSGQIIALVDYLTHILEELIKLSTLVVLMGKTIASMSRINKVLNTKSSMTYGTRTEPVSDECVIRFKGVSFRYGTKADEALSDVSFSIKKGQAVGIIGSTGSGKSSLVSLMARFYDVGKGKIEVLGAPIGEWDKSALHRRIAVVLQTPWLFRGTIAANLRFGKPEATDEQLWLALDMVRAGDFVREKPGMLEFEIEQGARNLSPGQRQRLALARALVTEPDVLILDDSMSSLDYSTEAAVRESLNSLPKDMAIVVVGERTAVMRHADTILVLDDGQLVGEGTHEELLRNCTVYKEIHQNSGAEDTVGGAI